jgi:diguanylate cyclase (GGDEF)-like protein
MKKIIWFITTVFMSAYYIGVALYYFNDSTLHQDILKHNIYQTAMALDYKLTTDNCQNIKQIPKIINGKLIENKYLSNISIYKGNKQIFSTSKKIIDKPQNTPIALNKGKITDNKYLKTTFTCCSTLGKNKYDVILTLNNQKIKSVINKYDIDYLIFFIFYPTFVVLLLGFILFKFIFTPVQQLKRYTTEKGVIIPPVVLIPELEELRTSTVEAFELLEYEKMELFKLSRTDSLTGLGNRTYLNEQLELMIDRTSSISNKFSMVCLDINNFKSINDSLGYVIGDELLVAIANILKEVLHEDDVITRISGDEFILLISSVTTNEKLERLLDKISIILEQKIIIGGVHLSITISIGITKYPENGDTLESLLQQGNIALSKSKKLGKNKYVYFDDAMLDDTLYLIELNNNMVAALNNDEYELYYQPQINIQTNKIVGAEALIRWNKNGQQISPTEFIPIAEDSGFIIDLGWWIITSAFKEKLSWEKQGIGLSMSINIAARQLIDVDFYDTFKFYLHKFGINPKEIVLEITEYIFLYENDSLLDSFYKLKELGISIALDDFGTGYSSLSYIKRFPIDIIKIDKSFMDDYNSLEGEVFIETIISMSINLEIDLIAEGVENQAQLDFLSKRHCKKYQGYLCSKPLPSKEFKELYEKNIN